MLIACLLAATLQLSITGTRSWPADTTITVIDLESGTRELRVIPAGQIANLQQLELAPGRYRVALAAAHHRDVWRDVTVPREGALNLGELAMPPANVIRGQVRGGAAIIRMANVEVRTDAAGRFVLEPPPDAPRYLTISAPSRGTRVIDVPKSESDVELPPVALAQPATIEVGLASRPPGEITAILQQRSASEVLVPIARKVITRQKTIAFDGIGGGSYVLLLRGAAPLEQYATPVILGDGDRRHVDVAIQPRPFDGAITIAGKPLRDAAITLQNDEFEWRGELRTDGEGRVHGTSWQTGAFTATVLNSQSSVVLPPNERIAFAVDVAQRLVRGTITDRDGLPVPGARVTLKTRDAEHDWTARADSAADGSFSFAGVHAGEQKLMVSAEGYLMADPMLFALAPSDTLHDASLVLDPGTHRVLHVVDAEGHPSAFAELVSASNGVVRSYVVADHEGRAEVPVAGAAVVFALARDGSFAATRSADGKITLPRAESSLRITTRTTGGQPLADISLLPAFDGEVMPLVVAQLLGRAHGTPLQTDAAGDLTLRNIPAGACQFWPYSTNEEAESIVAAGAMDAPITVNVKSGENAIVVDFQSR